MTRCAHVYGDGTVCGEIQHTYVHDKRGRDFHAFIPQDTPSEGELKPTIEALLEDRDFAAQQVENILSGLDRMPMGGHVSNGWIATLTKVLRATLNHLRASESVPTDEATTHESDIVAAADAYAKAHGTWELARHNDLLITEDAFRERRAARLRFLELLTARLQPVSDTPKAVVTIMVNRDGDVHEKCPDCRGDGCVPITEWSDTPKAEGE